MVSLFATMARQLAKFNDAFRDQLILVLSESPNAARQGIQPQLKKLFVEPLGRVTTPHAVVAVVEALDECANGRAPEITQILASVI
jgi:hypothetical protein